MSNSDAADAMPQFIDGFEPPVEPQQARVAPTDDDPLELPDMDGVEITLLSSTSLFESGFDALATAAECDPEAHDTADLEPESEVVETVETEAPSQLYTSAALAAGSQGADDALPRLLKAVFTRWFDHFNVLKYKQRLGGEICDLAYAAAAIATVDAAHMLHHFAQSPFDEQCRESADATRDALMWRLTALEPALECVDVWPRIAELTPAIAAGDSSVRLKCLWQALKSVQQEGFHTDMYFYYSEPVVDRISARMPFAGTA